MVTLRLPAMVGLAAAMIGSTSAAGQEANARGRILDTILATVMCCSTDIQFTKPANASNIPVNLGIGVSPGTGGEATIQLGPIVHAADGKAAFKQPYVLDASCRPAPVQGATLAPGASLYTVAEIGARKTKNSAEELWPVVNATFQSVLLGALKLPSPPTRHTCLRQHLERVIHGEEGSLR